MQKHNNGNHVFVPLFVRERRKITKSGTMHGGVLQKAWDYKDDISKFLRDIVAIPSESGQEEKVVLRIKEEMLKVGFDKVNIDPMGNILGYMGHGKHVIAMDAHIDTVGIGNKNLWDVDPYHGFEDDEIIIDRGTSDQKAAWLL